MTGDFCKIYLGLLGNLCEGTLGSAAFLTFLSFTLINLIKTAAKKKGSIELYNKVTNNTLNSLLF